MTYKELIDLKFKQGVSTGELVRRYPEDLVRVSEVALMDIPEHTLKVVVKEKGLLNRILRLKRRFA